MPLFSTNDSILSILIAPPPGPNQAWELHPVPVLWIAPHPASPEKNRTKSGFKWMPLSAFILQVLPLHDKLLNHVLMMNSRLSWCQTLEDEHALCALVLITFLTNSMRHLLNFETLLMKCPHQCSCCLFHFLNLRNKNANQGRKEESCWGGEKQMEIHYTRTYHPGNNRSCGIQSQLHVMQQPHRPDSSDLSCWHLWALWSQAT